MSQESLSSATDLKLLGPASRETDAYDIRKNCSRCCEAFHHVLGFAQNNVTAIQRLSSSPKTASGDRPIFTIQDLRDEFEQFRVWCANLGVFAADNGALDHRLRDALDVRQGVVTLLESLYTEVSYVTDLFEKDEVGNCQKNQTSTNESDSESADSDVADLTNFELAALALQNCLGHVSSIITKLHHLAHVIRAAGTQSRTLKAADFVHYVDGVNQTEIFENQYLPLVLQHRFHLQEPLLARFCKLISERRRRFQYQAIHQQRLAYDNQADDLVQNVVAVDDRPAPIIQNVEPKAAGDNTNALKQRAPRNAAAPTSATTFQWPIKRPPAPSTLGLSTVRLNIQDLEFPPAPKTEATAKYFECPYCCLLVHTKKTEAKLWRKHVVHDLQPFICIEPACPDPYTNLETWNDWVEHQKWSHALEWWCDGKCSGHSSLKFEAIEDYYGHLINQHNFKESSGDSAGNLGTDFGGWPSQEPFKHCPFCDFQPDRTATSAGIGSRDPLHLAWLNQKQLQTHIFNHILSMFMLALPERYDVDDKASVSGESAPPRTDAASGAQSEIRNEKFASLSEGTNESVLDNDEWLSSPTQNDESDSLNYVDRLWKDYGDPANDAILNHLAIIQSREGIEKTAGNPQDELYSAQAKRQMLFESLPFEGMGDGIEDIRPPHPGTCQWLLQDNVYQEWLDDRPRPQHRGVLWIKGKPGCGKSTIMKFVFLEHLEQNRNNESSVVVAFFFNARGSIMERSTTGMYRSFLFQILEKFPKLKKVLDAVSLRNKNVQIIEWSRDVLADLFAKVAYELIQCHITCFIDALDECSLDAVQDMVRELMGLGLSMNHSLTKFRVCFSAHRGFPISRRYGISVLVENAKGHEEDIQRYVGDELRTKSSEQTLEITRKIVEMAYRVFLWAVLVVNEFNREFDIGRIHRAHNVLTTSPREAVYFFGEMILGNDGFDSKGSLCLSLILFAHHRLALAEVYSAVANNSLDVIEAIAGISDDDMQEYISAHSKGLVTSKGNIPKTMCFIHECIRDYLLSDTLTLVRRNPLQFKNVGVGHELLKQCCYSYYIRVANFKFPVETWDVTKEISVSDLVSNFPFLTYAVQNVLYHSEMATRSQYDQIKFIKNFNIRGWVAWYNMLQQPGAEHYPPDVSLLHVLADQKLPILVGLLR